MSIRTRMSSSSKYFEFEINWAKRTALTCRDHILQATVREPGLLTSLADGPYGFGHQRRPSSRENKRRPIWFRSFAALEPLRA
jgi:hypothetical protein